MFDEKSPEPPGAHQTNNTEGVYIKFQRRWGVYHGSDEGGIKLETSALEHLDGGQLKIKQ